MTDKVSPPLEPAAVCGTPIGDRGLKCARIDGHSGACSQWPQPTYDAVPKGEPRDAKDAARYRWLKRFKSFGNPESPGFWGFYNSPLLNGPSLDAAIDAAIKESDQ